MQQQPVIVLPDASRQQFTKRVLCIATTGAILAIISCIGQYVMVKAMVIDLIRNLKAAGQDVPEIPEQAVGGVRDLIWQIGLALLVPACGIYGALQKNRNCLAAFAGCSCLGCCCSVCTLICIIIPFTMVSAAVATIGPVLKDCDPTLVCPPYQNSLQAKPVIDCLANNTWPEEYTRRYDWGGGFPAPCQSLYLLNCDIDPSSSLSFSQESRWTTANVRRLTENVLFPVLGAGRRTGGDAPPMPANPLEQCKTNEDMYNGLHVLIQFLQTGMPGLRTFFYLLVVTTGLGACVRGLSALWGKQLHDSLNFSVPVQPVAYVVNQQLAQPHF